jgi:hypothetical protein
MKPRTLSASAIGVAEKCLLRYKAEQIDRVPDIDKDAARAGSAVHGALELFVTMVYINKTHQRELKLLIELYGMSFLKTFGYLDHTSEIYVEGVEMLDKWYERDHLANRQVLSCEIKKSFPIKTSIGDIPFNYILDRFDKLSGDRVYGVVDYKSNRWGIRPGDLLGKIQPRAYALAMQLEYPDAEKIWVEFDMLRHDGPVGIVFTKEDNRETLRYLRKKAQEIVDADPDKLQPKLNNECRFCVAKATCPALRANLTGGGIFSVTNRVDLRAQLEFQKAGLEALITELDDQFMTEAQQEDIFTFDGDTYKLEIGPGQSRRELDSTRVKTVIGEELWSKYGSDSMTMAAFDKLLKSEDITSEQKAKLKLLVRSKPGNAKVKVVANSPFDTI